MSNPGESSHTPPEYATPLLNLSVVRSRMDSLQKFLSESVNKNVLISDHQMSLVSAEISSAIQQIIVNGAALLACSQSQSFSFASAAAADDDIKPSDPPDLKIIQDDGDCSNKIKNYGEKMIFKEEDKEEIDMDCEIVEIDAVELLAEHVHFCEICGKGFKRDANLRMHMRAHGNQFKTVEALAKPIDDGRGGSAARGTTTRFSCPFEGCNRNKKHRKFRPLKSVICVRNHFKRSHCPKMYSCNRCNKKSFSVVADLKSHQKHCGEARWKCSCGTSFSRKDKLFGHMALFEGHMPAVVAEEVEKKEGGEAAAAEEVVVMEEDDGDCSNNEFFEGLLDGFDSIESYNLQDVFSSPGNSGWEFCGFGQ